MPTKDELSARFETFKEESSVYSCYENTNENGTTYGYIVYNIDSEGNYLTTVINYQHGLMINYYYYEGTELIDNLNLTPDFPEI